MAGEVSVARESSVDAVNGVNGGGRTVPRLYDVSNDERYPHSIHIGLRTSDETAEKDKAILESVIGQMSDGMWENSRQMEKYWRGMTFSQDKDGQVTLRHVSSYNERVQRWIGGRNGSVYSWDEAKPSGYNRMGSREAREFLAKKIKQIVDAERKENPSVGKWRADNNNALDYMHKGVTVADAYSLYKRLKGR